MLAPILVILFGLLAIGMKVLFSRQNAIMNKVNDNSSGGGGGVVDSASLKDAIRRANDAADKASKAASNRSIDFAKLQDRVNENADAVSSLEKNFNANSEIVNQLKDRLTANENKSNAMQSQVDKLQASQ